MLKVLKTLRKRTTFSYQTIRDSFIKSIYANNNPDKLFMAILHIYISPRHHHHHLLAATTMKSSFSGHWVLAAAFLCCLIAALQVEGMSLMNHPEGNHNHHGRKPSMISISCFCLRCRLLYKNLPLPPPPPPRLLPEEIDTRFGTEKRLVPGGPNPLHN